MRGCSLSTVSQTPGRARAFSTWRARASSRATARSRSTPPTSGARSPVRCRAALTMTLSPLAGKPAPKELLIDPARLVREDYARQPDLADPSQCVSFGTSGHRGSPLTGSFTEAHILAISQAICEYRLAHSI